MWRVRILIAVGLALAVLQAGATFAGVSPFVAASIAPDLPRAAAGKPAPGMFLVSKRALGGTYFGETVIYLVEHDEQGTLGLIVNRSSNIRLADALPDIEQPLAARHRLYSGGPVEPAMIMMLLRGESAAQGMAHVAGRVYVSADRRVLDAALEAGRQASEFRLYIGYSGWSAGQLDAELERGSWHVVTADPDAVFSEESDSLWEWLIERLEPEGIEV
jgi:putative transcriptional regulator